jgi:hypothetical protein
MQHLIEFESVAQMLAWLQENDLNDAPVDLIIHLKEAQL